MRVPIRVRVLVFLGPPTPVPPHSIPPPLFSSDVALACEVALALARAHWRGTGARAVCAPIAAAC